MFQLSEVKDRLIAVGISTSVSEQIMNLLVNLDLLSEGHVCKLISSSDQIDKFDRQCLAEQVYAHLVRWLGQCLCLYLAMPQMYILFNLHSMPFERRVDSAHNN